jgi:uncharacterized Fe-S cluster protein YjdI
MKKIIKYKRENLTVNWEPQKCSHAAKCVNGLPSVFDSNKKPWVNMDGASIQEIKNQVISCPSGALSLKSEIMDKNQKSKDQSSNINVSIMEKGPYIIKGPCVIVNEKGEETIKDGNVALCRCGASANKPYCDGSHKNADVW